MTGARESHEVERGASAAAEDVRRVTAVRYVTPLREGGSLPGLFEADDDGLYVVKLRGAGQGTPVLVAELLCAELARAAGLPVPEVVQIDLDAALGRNEPDPEIRQLLMASVGLNLGLDYLPGAITYDPAAELRDRSHGGPSTPPDAELASRVVLFDAFVTNPDRSARNPNMLRWHRRLWLIDHGAALYFQYSWQAEAPTAGARAPFSRIQDHVLLTRASQVPEAAAHLQACWTPAFIADLTSKLPESWLSSPHFQLPSREQYAQWLTTRVDALPHIAQEVARVRANLV